MHADALAAQAARATHTRPEFARVPGLDGLRAISIGMVVISHVASGNALYDRLTLNDAIDLGNTGVRVFFVISGFLISSILFAEIEHSGTINLGRFYFRRTLRIFPAYYTLVVCVGAAAAIGWVPLRPGDLLHAATYTTNYHADRAWSLGHAWSLAVEEQFYLLWPAVLLLAGRRRGLVGAACFVVGTSVVRIAIHAFHTPLIESLALLDGSSFETAADAIAVGCVLAGVNNRLWANGRVRRFLESGSFGVVPIGVILVAASRAVPRHLEGAAKIASLVMYHGVGILAIDIGIALCVAWAAQRRPGWVSVALNSRPALAIGALSYSLYLWQQPFLNRDVHAWTTRLPQSLLLVIAAAVASYFLIETPMLRLRRSIDARRYPTAQPTLGARG